MLLTLAVRTDTENDVAGGVTTFLCFSTQTQGLLYLPLCRSNFHLILRLVISDTNLLLSVAAFEVNFMDDVGQTLLNWASAFGTQEMVNKSETLSKILKLVQT